MRFSAYFCLILLIFACSRMSSKNEQTHPTKNLKIKRNPNINKAEEFFVNNCSMCHNTDSTDLVGPGLKNIEKKRSIDWIVDFTTNPVKMIAEDRDTAAINIYLKYKEIPMPSYSNFSREDALNLIEYLKFKNVE